MRSYLTPRFVRLYADAPAHIQKAFDQKLKFLLQNLRHPSLRAKKYDEARGISLLKVPFEGKRDDLAELPAGKRVERNHGFQELLLASHDFS